MTPTIRAALTPQNPNSVVIALNVEAPSTIVTTLTSYSGIGSIRYVCEDPQGGMVTRKSSLPPKLQEISEDLSQEWGLAAQRKLWQKWLFRQRSSFR